MSTRKRRESAPPPPTVNVGPVWLVRSKEDEQYVSAENATAAVEVFYQLLGAKRASDPSGTEVREVMNISMTVHAVPPVHPGKTDGH